ncbi:MAG TPA: SCP-like extracellular [Leucothrix mucor]|uniref:SCP-like extracellular n=1 Tax=Leucothrix mucor TaxID=45248 RepID=A0A7V2SYK6_LEUMU|nr:SCP-like extracellular [Leucothrix mucor]
MNKYLLLLLLPLFTMLACSSSPIKEVRYANTGSLVSNVVPALFRGTLTSHNSVRARLGLKPLYWSNKLARYAQQWANHQAKSQNCAMQHRPHYAGPFKQIYGENLFWASPKRWSDGRVELQRISIAEVIKSWADEDIDYNYNNNSCRSGAQCGHYTQIVWRETQAVGCAIAVCPDKAQLWVCNYSPPGNYIGEKPY